MRYVCRWKVYVFAIIVLVGGIAIGIGGACAYWKMPDNANEKPRNHFRPRLMTGEKFSERFAKNHNITPEQQVKVAAAFQRFLDSMEQLRKEFTPRMQKVHDEFIDEMHNILPPATFEKWNSQRKNRFFKKNPGHPQRPAGFLPLSSQNRYNAPDTPRNPPMPQEPRGK